MATWNFIDGTPQRDNLKGTEGQDVIDADGGNDKILGNGATDIYLPGSGDDKIIFDGLYNSAVILPREMGHDKFYEFDAGTDKIVFNGFNGLKEYQDIEPFISYSTGADQRGIAVIDVSGAQGQAGGFTTITLYGVSDLDATSFNFDQPIPERRPVEDAVDVIPPVGGTDDDDTLTGGMGDPPVSKSDPAALDAEFGVVGTASPLKSFDFLA